MNSLFVDQKIPKILSDSYFGKLLQRLYIPHLSEILVVFSLFLIFFGKDMNSYFGQNLSQLAPWSIALALIFSDKGRLKLTKSNYWYIYFVVCLLVSGFIGYFGGMSPRLLLLGTLLFTQLGFAFLLGQVLNKKIMTSALFFLGSVVSLYAIMQFALDVNTSSTWVSASEVGLDRVFGSFGSPNVLGVLMAILGLATMGSIVSSKKKILTIPLLLFVTTMILSYSRTAWVAFASALVVTLIIYNYKYLLLSPILFLSFLIPSVSNRFLNLFTAGYLVDASLDGRVWSYINAIHLFAMKPFLGFGPGTYGGQLALSYASPVYLSGIQSGYTALYFTDNQFTELLVQVGIVGLFVFLGFIYSLYARYILQFKKTKDPVILTGVAILTAFLVSGLFANVLEFGAITVPTGLLLGLYLYEK